MKKLTQQELNELPDGLHSLTREEYDQIDRVNFSTLKFMEKSPAHYRHQLTARDDADTDARKRGRAVALATFEPERFRSECVVWDAKDKAGKPKARKGEDWEAFVDRNPDREHLTEAMHADAVAIAQAARSCAMALPYLSGGRGEQTLIWTHRVEPVAAVPGYEIRCKGRLDFVAKPTVRHPAGAIVDLKNSRDASPEGFGKQCLNYGSHIQGAFYSDGLKAALKLELPYVIVAVEPKAPFVAQVYELPAEVVALGREKYSAWLDRLNQCRLNSEWPGYAAAPMALQLPRWAMPDDKESDLSEMGLTA